MRRKVYDIQEFTLSVAKSGTSGTQADPCNPLRGTLKKVQVKCADDASVTGMKVELLRYDNPNNAYVTVYTGDDAAIKDDAAWHDADSDKDLNIALNFAADGNYTWRITPDAAPGAAMSVKIRRIIEV